MKKFSILLLSVLLTACQAAPLEPTEPNPPDTSQQTQSVPSVTPAPMKLSSPVFTEGQALPSDYTCQGEDTNPPLMISDVPQAAQSLALIVDDPDAPGGTWVHWTLWNLPVTTTEIPEKWVVPDVVVEGMTGFGEQTYGGPCPPSGSHRYFFKLFALDQTLDIPATSGAEELESAMQGHVLDSATLMGTYQKQ